MVLPTTPPLEDGVLPGGVVGSKGLEDGEGEWSAVRVD